MAERQSFLIDPKVQWALTRRVLMHWSCLLVGLVVLSTIVALLFRPDVNSIAGVVRESFSMQAPLLLMMFTLVPLFLRDIVKLSNRFVGPMIRLRSVLSDLAEGGDGRSISFRPGDYWHEAARDFNRFYQRHQELKQRCDELEQEVERLRGQGVSAR
ncbi:MAG: hypothetical protein AAFX06_24750 [Planctomycetota bacterium]